LTDLVTLRNGWQVVRVTAERPCEVCRKPDWCGHVVGGGSLCQRVESLRRVGDAGWFHLDASGAVPATVDVREVAPDYGGMLKAHRRYRQAIKPIHVENLVRETGVDAAAYRSLGVGWDGRAYTFPMRDGDYRIIGLRKRTLDGAKWAEPGSRSGLFISENDPIGSILLPEEADRYGRLVGVGLLGVGATRLGCGQSDGRPPTYEDGGRSTPHSGSSRRGGRRPSGAIRGSELREKNQDRRPHRRAGLVPTEWA